MRILRKHKAELIRFEDTADSSKGYYDEDGNFIRGTDSKPELLLCCIQPAFELTKQIDLPEGIREKDCRVLWTHTELKGASEVGSQEADVIRYEGLDFEVFDIGHWNGAGCINAWEAVIIRKDKL